MKNRLLLLWFLCFPLMSLAQIIKKDSLYSKFIVGLNPMVGFREDIFYEPNGREKETFLSFTPYVYGAYNLHKNLYVGADFGYEFFHSSYYKKKNFVEAGVFTRYWVPFTINHRFFRKLRLYVQVNYTRTNFIKVADVVNVFEYKKLTIEEDFIISNGLNQERFAFPIGLTFRLKRYLYAEINWQYQKYINGTGVSGFNAGIGFNVGKRHRNWSNN